MAQTLNDPDAERTAQLGRTLSLLRLTPIGLSPAIGSIPPAERSETSWYHLVPAVGVAQPLPVWVAMARPTEKNPNGANRNRRRGAAVGSDLSAKITLTVTDVQRFLGKSKRAFYLLRRDPMEEFPTPFLIRGRDHWLMRDLLDWIESRRRRDAIPGRTALLGVDRSLALGTPDA